MLSKSNRAFKEWAVACDALRDGRQILLIRKGGIREEGGVFTMTDHEFFLLPTFEHQKAELLRSDILPHLATRSAAPAPATTVIETYAVVDTILTARDDAQVNAAVHETIWNAVYVKQRFEFNPYDPLYLVLLRAYRLPVAVEIPLLPEYVGCRSWVTLNRYLPTQNAVPSVPDQEFARRKQALLAALQT